MFAILTDSTTDRNVASRTVVQNGASMHQASVIFVVVPIKNEKWYTNWVHSLWIYPVGRK